MVIRRKKNYQRDQSFKIIGNKNYQKNRNMEKIKHSFKTKTKFLCIALDPEDNIKIVIITK